MNIENYIEGQYRELKSQGLNTEYFNFYKDIEHNKLSEILSTLHYNFTYLFRRMNERLPTDEYEAHFWAYESRLLLSNIQTTLDLFNTLKQSKYAFEIDNYYFELINKCNSFLSSSGGSTLPAYMEKIELYYIQPIFKSSKSIVVKNRNTEVLYNLKQIGEGSYANVYKYKDNFYNCNFVIKRAKNNLSDKEKNRFKREFEEMKKLSSPYILKVFRYSDEKNEYIMEYMDYTLYDYISKNNAKLSISQRKSIVQQVLRAFDYIHSKNLLHRDISPKNILIKKYDDVLVIKISDFGLVKTPDSNLTTFDTDFKGYFNDPALRIEGFHTYNIFHETYALTMIIYYILTGKTTNTDKIPDEKLRIFVQKGLDVDKLKRFNSVSEMIKFLS